MIGTMLVVLQGDVGTAALARMRRDGVLTPLTDHAGVSPGAVPPRAARAIALTAWIPGRAAATGLAALWVHGLTGHALAPAHVEVVVPRGAHPDPPVGIPPCRWTFTTHQAAYSRAHLIAGIRIASPADAAASALRTADLAEAMLAAYGAVTAGLITAEELRAAISEQKGTQGRVRMRNACRAVLEALEGR